MPIALGSIPANRCSIVVLPAMTSDAICSAATPLSRNSCSIERLERPRHHGMLQPPDHPRVRDAHLNPSQDVVAQADLSIERRSGIDDLAGSQVDQHGHHGRRADVDGDSERRRLGGAAAGVHEPVIAGLLQDQRQSLCLRRRQQGEFRRRSHGQIVVALPSHGLTDCLRQRLAGRQVAGRQFDALPQRIVSAGDVDAERRYHLGFVSQQRADRHVDLGAARAAANGTGRRECCEVRPSPPTSRLCRRRSVGRTADRPGSRRTGRAGRNAC